MSGWNWGEVLNVWEEILFRASWQGGLALLAAWGISLVLTGALPRAQCWVWRLAYGKFALCVLMVAPLALPLLPAEVRRVEESRVVVQVEASEVKTDSPAMEAGDGNGITANGTTALAVPGIAARVAMPRVAERATLTWGRGLRVGLFVLWVVGVMAYFWNVWRAFGRTLRLRRSGRVMEEGAVVAMCAEIAVGMGISRVPRLLRTEDAAGPLLTGVFRPAILLPASLVERSDAQKMRMILAHELAHVKRQDLVWNAFHAVVEGLFFFHPVIWLTRRDVRLAQELACDQVALGATGATVGAYGETLVDVMAQQNRSRQALVGVGVVVSSDGLRRRLVAMKTMKTWSRRRVGVCAGVVALVGVVGVLPWRVVAQSAPATTAPAALAKVELQKDVVTQVIPIKFRLDGAGAVRDELVHLKFVGPNTRIAVDTTANTLTLTGGQADVRSLAEVISAWEYEAAKYLSEATTQNGIGGNNNGFGNNGFGNTRGARGFGNNVQPVASTAIKREDLPPAVLRVVGTLSVPVVEIKTPLDGKLMEIVVKEGSTVKVGDVLFKLDDRAARAAYEIAQVNVKGAQLEVEQPPEGDSVPIIPIALRKNKVELATIQLQIAQNALDDLTICSPIDGVVQFIDLTVGQLLQRDKLLTKVVSTNDLQVYTDVPAFYEGDVRVGQKFTIQLDGELPEVAEISYVGSPAVQPPGSGQPPLSIVRGKVIPSEHLNRYKAGMRVTVYITPVKQKP